MDQKDNLAHPTATTSENVELEASPVTVPPTSIKQEKVSDVESEDEDYESEDENKVLSHKEAMKQFQDGLAELIVGEPLLSHLPTKITLEEVNSQIALEYGQAMTVFVHRADGETLPVVVIQNGTVLDLKKAIQMHITLKLARENMSRTISWKYIWKSYWLYFNGQKLTEDLHPLKDYGLSNGSEVTFIKRLRQR